MEDAEEDPESSGGVLTQRAPSWAEGGSGGRPFGTQGVGEGGTEDRRAQAGPAEENNANKNQLPKVGLTGRPG